VPSLEGVREAADVLDATGKRYLFYAKECIPQQMLGMPHS